MVLSPLSELVIVFALYDGEQNDNAPFGAWLSAVRLRRWSEGIVAAGTQGVGSA
jgi:hypothetical protein